MRHRALRVAAPTALAALLALVPALVVPAFAASAAPVAPAAEPDPVAAAPKVVIVVGATHEATDSYRSYGDLFYNEAIKYTPNVVRVYSPNATWNAVKAAAQNASILIYLGHGSGYPKFPTSVFDPDHHDGMGLNTPTNLSDDVAKYYGENYVANEIKLAKNAVVFLSHLCYASGNSESGYPEPSYAVAKQRIDNFASGFIKAGARTVIADVWNSAVTSYIRSIFTTNQTIGNMWTTSVSNHGHQMPFVPTRNPSYRAIMDPNTWTTGFYRSIVADLDMRTTDVIAGAGAAPTDTNPAAFAAPGAAAIGADAVPLFDDASLANPTGAALPAAARVRVHAQEPGPAAEGGPTPPPSLQVQALDGATAGWASGAGLLPRDSAGPELWSMDGPRTVSPNYDGLNDALTLVGRLSESVPWTATISSSDGAVLRTLTGTGHRPAITWTPTIDGAVAPEGEYTWRIQAADAWGNAPLDASGTFTVVYEPTPDTAVLSFKPGAAVTTSSSATFTLKFQGPVSGLFASDITRSGSATGCVVAPPAGGPTTFTISVTKCSTGTVTLTLASLGVTDLAGTAGPAGPISAKVTIDRTAPKVASIKPTVRDGAALAGASSTQALPSRVSWTGTDGGSGVASYDVERSTSFGAWTRLASTTTATSLNVDLKPGASYRFRVRARDKVGNLSAWVTTSSWYPVLTQQSSTTVKYTGAWARADAAAYSAGTLKHASAAGASASLTFTGRAVAWVTTLRPTNGEVLVYVDGVLAGTVDTAAATVTERAVVFSRSWISYGTHTIRLVAVGTADRPRVELDAFAVVR
jgi:hypothetical protein